RAAERLRLGGIRITPGRIAPPLRHRGIGVTAVSRECVSSCQSATDIGSCRDFVPPDSRCLNLPTICNKAPPMAKAGSVWATVLWPALLALAACGQDNRYAAPPPQKVEVASPLEQSVSDYFESTGNMAAINTVDLVARVQGFVQAISYADGDYVKKGTSLFTIEPEPYRLKVEAAKASVTSAHATLKQNEAEYARQADLVQRQVSAQDTYDNALGLRASAQADLQSEAAHVRSERIN